MGKINTDELEITERESQQALLTKGQRRINVIWEMTQAIIAIVITIATITVAGVLALEGVRNTAAFLLLSNAFFVIIGFYFGRTNHQRTGGVGYKDLNQGR